MITDVTHKSTLSPLTLPAFGARLKRLRRLRGLKQAVIADLAGVDQATVSRWEAGAITPPAARTDALLRGLAGAADDRGLRRLVESSRLTLHLVTDCDHRLLAASSSRAQEWRVDRGTYYGQSLWRFATPAIIEAEVNLGLGDWWDADMPAPVVVDIADGRDDEIRIDRGHMLWERLWLADGTPARLCTMIQ